MKKKLLLIPIVIVFILILTFSLVACNKASTQGLLANILNDHSQETFVYEVYNSETDQVVGEYTVTLKAYQQGATVAEMSDATLFDVNKGILVSGNLALTDGTAYSTYCYFDIINGSSYMIPAYTFRKQVVSGEEKFKLSGSYGKDGLEYTKTIKGNPTDGTIKVSGTYYDNNEFHQSLRTITTFSTSLSFQFNVPLVTENEDTLVSLTASCTKKEDVAYKNGEDKTASCYVVNISRATDVAGVTQTLYYAADDISISGWGVKNALIKIEEPFKKNNTQYKMVYTLKSIIIA